MKETSADVDKSKLNSLLMKIMNGVETGIIIVVDKQDGLHLYREGLVDLGHLSICLSALISDMARGSMKKKVN